MQGSFSSREYAISSFLQCNSSMTEVCDLDHQETTFFSHTISPSSVALNQGHSQIFSRWRRKPSEREPLCGPVAGVAGVHPGAPLSPNFAAHAWSLTSKFADCVYGIREVPIPCPLYHFPSGGADSRLIAVCG